MDLSIINIVPQILVWGFKIAYLLDAHRQQIVYRGSMTAHREGAPTRGIKKTIKKCN